MVAMTSSPQTTRALTASVLHAARFVWQHAVFEDAETGPTMAEAPWAIDALPTEILVYRNESSRQQWETLGASPTTRGTLIHLLREPGSLTIVTDDPPSEEMRRILNTIQQTTPTVSVA